MPPLKELHHLKKSSDLYIFIMWLQKTVTFIHAYKLFFKSNTDESQIIFCLDCTSTQFTAGVVISVMNQAPLLHVTCVYPEATS